MAHRIQADAGMINDEGQVVDLYIPRKCEYTNMILDSGDKSSVQINFGHVNEHGVFNDQVTTVILSGYLRQKGQSAGALESVLRKKNFYPFAQ